MNATGKESERVAFNPRKAPKSRNGCLRCKAKRLKCDEAKPECQNCKLRQMQCPGYKPKTFVWSTKHEKHSPQKSKTLAGPAFTTLTQQPLEGTIESATSVSQDDEHALLGQDRSFRSSDLHGPPSPADSQKTEVVVSSRRNSNEFTDSLSAIRHQVEQSTIPEYLLHLPTMLVEYYFNYVCQIFSSFDGSLNPFRSTVGRLWDGSAPIYYAIQSMAAAYLSNHFPRMSQVGKQMQRETYKCLYQLQPGRDVDDLDRTLLTVLLVGQTTAWHDANDLGLVHLRTAKRLNRKRLQEQKSQPDNHDSRMSRQNDFFEQCILYWDMLGGFVEDDVDELMLQNNRNSPSRSTSSIQQKSTNPQIFPHPWTGVAPTAQELLAKVGRLIRKYRKHLAQEAVSLSCLSSALDFSSNLLPHEYLSTTEATEQAQALEAELLTFELPNIETLVDAGDENTPVQQYLDLAESYRLAGLLQIYKVFPSTLLDRLSTPYELLPSEPTEGTSANNQLHRLFKILLQPPTDSSDDLLVAMALRILNLLERLPPNSGTRCLQPLILISAASELRFPSTTNNFLLDPAVVDPATSMEYCNPGADFVSLPDLNMTTFPPIPNRQSGSGSDQPSIFNSITSQELDIASARKFAMTRLQEFQLSLPAKPILKAEMIIKETWAKWDAEELGVYWMDVMDAKGWGSIFG